MIQTSQSRRTGHINYDDVVDDNCAENIGSCDDEGVVWCLDETEAKWFRLDVFGGRKEMKLVFLSALLERVVGSLRGSTL